MKKKIVSVVIVTRNRKREALKAVTSIYEQTYRSLEVILVDNASLDDTAEIIKSKYPKTIIVTSQKNKGGAGGRNLGLSCAKGKFIFFMDDDAFADSHLISELVRVLEQDSKIGIVQPKIYNMNKKNIIQGIGHDINLFTGRVFGIGVGEKDCGQYDEVMDIPMVGCAWLVKRKVIKRIGNYDEDIFIPYEDSDFSLRARKAGFRVCFAPKGLVWHSSHKNSDIPAQIQWLGITTTNGAYRIGRNKIIFMRKHATVYNWLIFFILMLPAYVFIHSVLILSSKRLDILYNYWSGVCSGVKYAVLYKKQNNHKSYHHQMSPPLPREKWKLWLLSLAEPVCWVIDKSAKSILDVGCGLGLPMLLIKQKRNFEISVGVDLFEPYIKKAKKNGIHSEYLTCDIKKMPFKEKTFDVVMALQVLEHMPKQYAWRLVKRMEKIAKKQVIISTPIGQMNHPKVDHNPLQIHKSAFYPREFEARGYKIVKFGIKSILGEAGMICRTRNPIVRKVVFAFHLLITPLFYLIPGLANYHMYAIKDINEK